jgi:hypothetical protein
MMKLSGTRGRYTYRCGNCNYPTIKAYIKDSNTSQTRNNTVLLTERSMQPAGTSRD